MQRYAGYVRVSRVSGREGASFISPDQQRAAIRRLATAKGIEVAEADITEELDVSGKSAIDDRQLGALVRRIEAGELQGLVCLNLRRFSRSLLDGITVAHRITRAGGRIVTDDFDSDSAMGKALLGLLLGLAEEELDARRAGWRDAQRRAASRGVWPSRPPFGYSKDAEGRLVPDSNGPLVTHVFKMRASGASLTACANYLRDNLDGRTFSRASIASIMKSRAYNGDIVNALKDGSDAIEVPDAHPALVSRQVWQLAQRKGKYQGGSGSIAGKGVLRGIVRCGGCMHTTTLVASGPPEARKPSYACRKHYADVTCPSPASVRVELLDGLVMPLVNERVKSGAIDMEAMLADVMHSQEAVAEAQRELEAYAAVSVAVVGAEVYGTQVAARRERLREAIEAADTVAWAAQAAITAPRDRMAEDRELARQLVERVEIRAGRGVKLEDRVTVVWR